jgi:hypothetical protein
MFASNRTSSVPHGRASTDINLDGSYKSYVMLCVIDLFFFLLYIAFASALEQSKRRRGDRDR